MSKEALISPLPTVPRTFSRDQVETIWQLVGARCIVPLRLAAFLGGCKGEPIGDNGYPADFDLKISAVSWTAKESLGFPI